MAQALLPEVQASLDAIHDYVLDELTDAGLQDLPKHVLSGRVVRQMVKWMWQNDLADSTPSNGVVCSVDRNALVAVYGYIFWRQNL